MISMTIKDAIKLQTELVSLLPWVGFNKYIASTMLGIEAMKRFEELRSSCIQVTYRLLPGETEEEPKDIGPGDPGVYWPQERESQ